MGEELRFQLPPLAAESKEMVLAFFYLLVKGKLATSRVLKSLTDLLTVHICSLDEPVFLQLPLYNFSWIPFLLARIVRVGCCCCCCCFCMGWGSVGTFRRFPWFRAKMVVVFQDYV